MVATETGSEAPKGEASNQQKRKMFFGKSMPSAFNSSVNRTNKYKIVSNKKIVEMEVRLIKYNDLPETALILVTNISSVKKYEKQK
jgi:hypothetical protein